MNTNPYAMPTSDLHEQQTGIAFFPVSISKLTILYIVTMGTYIVVWFYHNWKMLKEQIEQDYGTVWPIPRAIFCIFFTHSLFRIIQHHAQEKNIVTSWKSTNQATFFVALTIFGNVISNLTDKVSSDAQAIGLTLLGIALIVITYLPFVAVQQTVNQLNGDPAGTKNTRFTAANILWMIFFCFVWIALLLGSVILAGWIDLPVESY